MSPAERLAALAGEHGWTSSAVEANGAIALFLRRERDVLVGLFENGRWRCGLAMKRADAGVFTQTVLRELLTSGDVDAALDEIGQASRERRIEAASKRKASK